MWDFCWGCSQTTAPVRVNQMGTRSKDKRYDRGSELDSFIIRLHPCDSIAGGTEGEWRKRTNVTYNKRGESVWMKNSISREAVMHIWRSLHVKVCIAAWLFSLTRFWNLAHPPQQLPGHRFFKSVMPLNNQWFHLPSLNNTRKQLLPSRAPEENEEKQEETANCAGYQ